MAEFEHADVEEILKRAITIDSRHGAGRDSLMKAAEELGISPQAVEQAECAWLKEKQERGQLREFINHQRRAFWSHLASYVIVNAFLFGVDLMSDGRIEWAYWPLMGWGVGILFHALSTFNTHSEDFRKEFEEWKKNRA